jgi:hypothetical protein
MEFNVLNKYEHIIYEYPLFSENRVRREAVNHGVSDVLMWHSHATLESKNLKWCRPMDQMKQLGDHQSIAGWWFGT